MYNVGSFNSIGEVCMFPLLIIIVAFRLDEVDPIDISFDFFEFIIIFVFSYRILSIQERVGALIASSKDIIHRCVHILL